MHVKTWNMTRRDFVNSVHLVKLIDPKLGGLLRDKKMIRNLETIILLTLSSPYFDFLTV